MGAVRVIAPPNVTTGGHESDTIISVVAVQQAVGSPSTLTTNLTVLGNYDASHQSHSPGPITASTAVNAHNIHFDRISGEIRPPGVSKR